MPCCALRYCKSRYGKTSGLEFSLFALVFSLFIWFPPVIDLAREKWIQFVQIERGEENWLPSAASKLCSKHFRRENIHFGKTGRAVLKKGSVPYTPKEEPIANVEAAKPPTPTEHKKQPTPVSDDISDSESIFDSPREIALKAQVTKLQNQKIQYQAKNKKLGQQNRYLKRKLLKLKSKLSNLKKLVVHSKNFDIQKNVKKSLKATQDLQAL